MTLPTLIDPNDFDEFQRILNHAPPETSDGSRSTLLISQQPGVDRRSRVPRREPRPSACR